jgi:hypothetical protein
MLDPLLTTGRGAENTRNSERVFRTQSWVAALFHLRAGVYSLHTWIVAQEILRGVLNLHFVKFTGFDQFIINVGGWVPPGGDVFAVTEFQT